MIHWYKQRNAWLQAHPILRSITIYSCIYTTKLFFIVYALSLCYVLLKQPNSFLSFVLVPAIGVVIETTLRYLINRPRPYEVLHLTPLIPKETKGCSFPSRHSFSAAILSIALYTIHPQLGLLFLALSVWIALSRVWIGVHWISDVIAGLLLGWILGYIGFYLI